MALPRFFIIAIVKFIRLFTTTIATPARRLLRLHHFPATYTLTIPTTLTPSNPGWITLYIYHPPSYRLSRDNSPPRPCILNFHGGGFTIGSPEDDSLWAQTLVTTQNCIVISASYRLAPEYPYPIAIHDACDALLYLFRHSQKLCIDPNNIALSGFSAGGNLCFSMPLLLCELKSQRKVPQELAIKGIMAFYPALNRSISRDAKRLYMARPSVALPDWLVQVFDHSYKPPDMHIDRRNKFLSPGIQKEELLREALPGKIRILSCEFDMLCKEAEDFVERVRGWDDWVVEYECVKGVRHAWDKYPNAKPDPRKWYGRAGEWLGKEVWDIEELE